jgi:plasmid maintenance system antidote protein VapI
MSIDRKELAGTDFRAVATGERLAPVHPGDVLMNDFIEPMGLTRYRIAKMAGVQQRRIEEICAGNCHSPKQTFTQIKWLAIL